MVDRYFDQIVQVSWMQSEQPNVLERQRCVCVRLHGYQEVLIACSTDVVEAQLMLMFEAEMEQRRSVV